MFGKYNGFVSKARVSACMYFLVYGIFEVKWNFLWNWKMMEIVWKSQYPAISFPEPVILGKEREALG
jgi:hypothetical protein